mmetsp:Transcript_46078/g.76732  ORF Transcript_46078/g.76732 Transcript_46078/m.76732 type:complete len:188 (+) Transcript_46078:61-624(+)
MGTKCKHAGCVKVYKGPNSEGQRCQYHPGGPVFHEGEKYWSCCRRRTINFAEFLSTPGCAKGRCIFKDEKEAVAVEMPRFDMTESGTEASLTIYVKKIDPDSVHLSASRRRLKVRFRYDVITVLDIEVELAGSILPHLSKADIFGPKIEISLRKGDGTHWGKIGKVIDSSTGSEVHQRSEFAVPTAM